MNNLDGVDLVYFVQAVEISGKLIRIGLTHHFAQRLNTLRAENGGQLAVLGVQPDVDAARLERRLHKQFDAHRHHGEWFHPVEPLLQYVASATITPTRAEVIEFDDDVSVDAVLDAALPTLMTIDEIAHELRVTAVTVRRHVKGRNLPCVRVGGQIRFDMGDLLRDAHWTIG